MLLLSGCSGTRFGEALSRSFSSGGPTGTAAATGPAAPAPATAAATPARGGSAPAAPAAGGAVTTAAPRNATPRSTGNATPPATSVQAGASRPTTAANASPVPSAANPGAPPRPAPYRVTILLPQADAAAPAEVVTQALRAAGVPFEVETIERLGRPPATPAAPLSRPAPEPR